MPAKYLSIDLETTGLNPETCQILEVAAVVETGEWDRPVEALPSIRLLVEHQEVRGQAAALALNARLVAELADPGAKKTHPANVYPELREFLGPFFPNFERVTLAGKNVGTFDIPFLKKLPGWNRERFRHRVIDPGVLWFDPMADETVPDTAECMRRAGVTNDRPHEALSDCRAVVELIRRGYARRGSAPPPALWRELPDNAARLTLATGDTVRVRTDVNGVREYEVAYAPMQSFGGAWVVGLVGVPGWYLLDRVVAVRETPTKETA